MSFTEQYDGVVTGSYRASATHVPSGRLISITIGSDQADGSIPEADVEQVFSDLKELVDSSTEWSDFTAGRLRQSGDAWSESPA